MSTSEEQIRELLAAATPGPWVSTPTFWKHMERVPDQWWYAIDTTGPVAAYVQRENAFGPANAEFIAAAPDAVAFLLAEVDRLRAELAAVLAIHIREDRSNWCDHDEQIWPCDTARALGVS